MGLADRTPPTAEEYAAYPERFSNWGRWGDDDELGTLNFVTPEVRRAAAALVTEGRAVSLSRPLDTHAGPANPYPAHHFVAVEGSGGMLDYFGMFIHGVTQTHIDALSHLGAHCHGGNVYYNDAPFGPLRMPGGRRGSIEHWRDGITTRGVLYDIPRLRGTGWVEPGSPVHGWDLQDAAATAGIEPRSGDVVIIRCGHGAWVQGHPDEPPGFAYPSGVHASSLEYLYDTEAAALVWDWQDAPTAEQGLPNPLPIDHPLHVHNVALPYMGLPIVDNADLERVAQLCAELGRWEFQVHIAPLYIEGASGSPVNPVALF
ncbi:MAG: cyclase family protein [Acidimicrobiales bacterium]|nr:cyclase family protein [Acidimicrobiales bacterium]